MMQLPRIAVLLGIALLLGCSEQPPEEAPLIADAGQDQIVTVGQRVVLDAGGSSGGDATIVVAWSFDDVPAGSAVELEAAGSVSTSFVPDAVGSYVVRLTVTRGEASATDTTTVRAEPLPEGPTVSPIADQRARPGVPLEVPFELSHADPDSLTVEAASDDETLVPAAAIHVLGRQGERRLLLIPADDGFGSTRVTVLVRDTGGREASVSFTLLVARSFGSYERLPDDLRQPRDGDRFGGAVAISGSRALVGVPNSDHGGPAAGVVHAFVRSAEGWREHALIRPSEPPVVAANHTGARFGAAVGISGDIAVVGAPAAPGVTSPGRAYLYRRCIPSFAMCRQAWVEDAVLSGDPTSGSDAFGYAVTIDGDIAVVGAPYESVRGLPEAGAAYVFERDGTQWRRVAKLVSDDGDPVAYASFGSSVAISGSRIVVGAPVGGAGSSGAAYVFEHDGVTWNQRAQLQGSRNDDDHFGGAVAIHDDVVVVAAPQVAVDDGDPAYGAVFVFEQEGLEFVERARLRPHDVHPDHPLPWFGASLAIRGPYLMIGSRNHASHDGVRTGTVDVFARFEQGWTRLERLVPDALPSDASFGHAVAWDGGDVIVGARTHGVEERSPGAAFVFVE